MPETRRPLKVFLCHASADKPKVRELYRTLKRRGVQPWLDAENLIPGQNWEVEIPKALLSSDAIIICLSPNSVDKEGYVQKEIKFALDKALEMPEGRIFLIPARLEDCELPFSLRQYQAVNLYDKEGYTKLMKALKLRASQLERNTVELPKEREIAPEIKQVVEEKKSIEPKQETKTHKPSHEPSFQDVYVGGNKNNLSQQVIPALVKPEEKRLEAPKAKVEKPEPKKTKSPYKWNTAIIVALIGLIGTIIAALLGSPLIDKWLTPVAVATESATATITLTPQPAVPSKTIEPSQTPTQNITFTPTATSLPTEITDAKGVSMVLVPAGEFTMGRNAAENKEMPAHKVYLDAFYMDIYEITNARYIAFLNAGARPTIGIRSGYPDFPVNTTWFESDAYCKWRGARLPTEAEWEKAARGTDDRTYPWGEGIDCSYANYWKCKTDVTNVGSYEKGKSPYGIYDMAGNVAEWVADWFSDTYYQNSPFSNPLGPQTGQQKVRRGGSWYFSEDSLRVSSRFGQDPSASVDAFGFRCVRTP